MSHYGTWGPGNRRTAYPVHRRSESKASSNDGPSTPSRAPRHREWNSPYRSKPAINSALRCLVGKFEALDALSLPYEIPSLQPAPLQSARHSPKRRGETHDSAQRRLPTIISPGSRNLSRQDDVFIDDVPEDSTWDCSPNSTRSMMPRSVGRQLPLRQSKMSQDPLKPGKTLTKGESRTVSSTTSSTVKHRNTNKIDPPICAPKDWSGKKKAGTIRDRIRFFDGNIDVKNTPDVSLSPSRDPLTPFSHGIYRNTELSQTRTPKKAPPETPMFRVPMGEAESSSQSSGKFMEKGRLLSTQKSVYKTNTWTKQRAVFGEIIENPFRKTQVLAEGKPSAAVSPSTSPTRLRPYQSTSALQDETPPRGRSVARYEINETPTQNKGMPRFVRRRGKTLPSSKNVRTGVQRDVETRRNQISEKIEAIYKAKSQERRPQSDTQDTQETCEVSVIPKPQFRGDEGGTAIMTPQRLKDSTSFRSRSKVADMRMVFDGGASFSSPLSGPASKDLKHTPVPPKKIRAPAIPEASPPPSALPPPPQQPSLLPESPRKGGAPQNSQSHVPRKQISQKELQKEQQRLPTLPKEAGDPQIRPVGKPKQLKSNLIAEKLKKFEEIARASERPGTDNLPRTPDTDKYSPINKSRALVEDRKGQIELSPARGRLRALVDSLTEQPQWKGKGREVKKVPRVTEMVESDAQEMMDSVLEVAPTTPYQPKGQERKPSLARIGKRKHTVGMWNDMQEPQFFISGERMGHEGLLKKGTDGSQDDFDWVENYGNVDIETGMECGSPEMVIKEAECGLKEPKPLRLVEMKRMVLLCRDRDRGRERDIVRERGRERDRSKVKKWRGEC